MSHIADVKDKQFLSQLPAAIADCPQLQGGRVTLGDHLPQYVLVNSRVCDRAEISVCEGGRAI